MTAHSALGPSSAHRWMACSGSVALSALWFEKNPNADTSSPYAEEGTRAHELAERLLHHPELPIPGDDIDTMDDREMLTHCLRYRDYCQATAGDSGLCFIEKTVPMSRVSDVAFGTVDFAVYCAEYRHLHVIDFKYGEGVGVDPEYNPQAMLYAEGMRQYLYDHHRIKPRHFSVHIFQPRLRSGENIAHWGFSNLKLDDFVSNAAAAAIRTQTHPDEFKPGDKQCQWCVANPCRARASQLDEFFGAQFDDLDTAVEQKADESMLLDDAQLGQWLLKIPMLKDFVSKIEAHAYQRAMDGHRVAHHKLVEGRGSYQGDAQALEFILGDQAFKERSLRSKTELQKVLGTTKYKRVAAPCFSYRPGKPVLVNEDDKRDEYDAQATIDSMLEDI